MTTFARSRSTLPSGWRCWRWSSSQARCHRGHARSRWPSSAWRAASRAEPPTRSRSGTSCVMAWTPSPRSFLTMDPGGSSRCGPEAGRSQGPAGARSSTNWTASTRVLRHLSARGPPHGPWLAASCSESHGRNARRRRAGHVDADGQPRERLRGRLQRLHAKLELGPPSDQDASSVTGTINDAWWRDGSRTCWTCRGPCMVVDTACSSSLVALHLASQSLRAEVRDGARGRRQPHPLAALVASGRASDALAGRAVQDLRCTRQRLRAGEGCWRGGPQALVGRHRRGGTPSWRCCGIGRQQDGKSAGLTAPNMVAQTGCSGGR